MIHSTLTPHPPSPCWRGINRFLSSVHRIGNRCVERHSRGQTYGLPESSLRLWVSRLRRRQVKWLCQRSAPLSSIPVLETHRGKCSVSYVLTPCFRGLNSQIPNLISIVLKDILAFQKFLVESHGMSHQTPASCLSVSTYIASCFRLCSQSERHFVCTEWWVKESSSESWSQISVLPLLSRGQERRTYLLCLQDHFFRQHLLGLEFWKESIERG